MTSLDDLEVRRVKPFQQMCYMMYGTLWGLFVFLSLSFLKAILTKP